MRTSPTASKKFGRSGLARDEPRALPLFDDELRRSVRKDEPAVEPGCRREDDAEVMTLEEKLRKLLRGGGSRGLVLLRLR